MTTPPYTTKSGLQIGSLYTPTPRPTLDADALLLQRALIGKQDRKPSGGMVIIAAILAVASTAWVMLL